MHIAFPSVVQLLPIAVAIILLGGCSMTESRVRQQIVESEARTAAAQAQLEDRILGRFTRYDQAVATESERIRREMDAQAEAQRRMVIEALVRQRDALVAQARAVDEAISALTAPRTTTLRPLSSLP